MYLDCRSPKTCSWISNWIEIQLQLPVNCDSCSYEKCLFTISLTAYFRTIKRSGLIRCRNTLLNSPAIVHFTTESKWCRMHLFTCSNFGLLPTLSLDFPQIHAIRNRSKAANYSLFDSLYTRSAGEFKLTRAPEK